jgi:hypothetical protein
MTEREFVSAFEQQKKLFISQVMPGDDNRRALELFEKWLKGKLRPVKTARKSRAERKNDLGELLDRVVAEAGALLQDRDIRINCVSFNVPGIKATSRCIKTSLDDNTYYRICKTSPRKGRYSGKNLISVELVMDGHKNNIFIPMLSEKEDIERQLGLKIERERQTIEATGKYRFKILFDFDKYEEEEIAGRLALAMADFITVTSRHLKQIKSRKH